MMACHLMELMGVPGEVSGKSTISGKGDTHFDLNQSTSLIISNHNFNNLNCPMRMQEH